METLNTGSIRFSRRRFIISMAAAAMAKPVAQASGSELFEGKVNKNPIAFFTRPLNGFEAGFMTNIWQTANYLANDSGKHGIGLCTHNVLWSDARVFTGNSGNGGIFGPSSHYEGMFARI